MENKIIVYTYGVFDLLHPGHIRLLKRAKNLGDYLIVGVVEDAAVKKLKGADRPNLNQEDRAYMLKNLKYVDEVMFQKTFDPSVNLKSYKEKISILTKGDDWDEIPGTKTIENLGGKLVKLPYTKEFSTSSLIKKIRKVNKCL